MFRVIGLMAALLAPPPIWAQTIPAPTSAQTPPIMIATRDVAVTYRSIGIETTATYEMAWLAAQGKLRATIPELGWTVADHRAGTGFLVVEAERRVMDMPAIVLHGQIGPPAGASFTREGAQRIAGQPCTEWRYQGGAQQGVVCLTADGVMLRTRITAGGPAGATGGLEATQVRYEAQDPQRFQMPEGYQRVQPRAPRERPAR